MTHAEALAHNRAVLAVLDIARRSAAAIADTSRRPLAESFAVAALEELATTGRALLIVDENGLPILPADPDHGSSP